MLARTWCFRNPNQVVFEPEPEELITSHCNITRYQHLFFIKSNQFALLWGLLSIYFFKNVTSTKMYWKMLTFLQCCFHFLCMSKTIHNTVKYKDPLCDIVFYCQYWSPIIFGVTPSSTSKCVAHKLALELQLHCRCLFHSAFIVCVPNEDRADECGSAALSGFVFRTSSALLPSSGATKSQIHWYPFM